MDVVKLGIIGQPHIEIKGECLKGQTLGDVLSLEMRDFINHSGDVAFKLRDSIDE